MGIWINGVEQGSGGISAETDPIVGAITGLVKADGGGNISAAVADTDYSTPSGVATLITAGKKVRKVAVKTTSAKISGTTIMPADDTIPQITEGVEWIVSDAFTPTAADSIILIRFSSLVQVSATVVVTWAIFEDSNADAIDANNCSHTGLGTYGGAGSRVQVSISSVHSAVDTDARTYSVRLGPSGSATIQNYGSSLDDAGGIAQLGVLEIWELAP